MNELIYLDTSALAKWYIHEEQSEEVEAFIQEHGPVAISDLIIVEMATLLARRRREVDFDSDMEARIFAAFQEDIRKGYLQCHSFPEGLAEAALLLRVHLSRTAIRTMDLLHLAIAREIQAAVVATADRTMAEAAAILDFRVVRFDSRPPR
jgi:uncharacterized protein